MAATIKKADVLIFGAGPAGLATAQALARQLYTAIVFSDHTSANGAGFRNARTKHMHNVPGGWDHRDPADFRRESREDILARYATVEFRDVGVGSVRRIGPSGAAAGAEGGAEERDKEGDNAENSKMRFEAVDVDGFKYQGRRVVVASGIRDIMPEHEIPGYTALWGRTIYHCLFCHGYEERGHRSSAVLATGLLAINPHFATGVARMAARLADTVNVYTNGNEDLGGQLRVALRDATRFRIVNDRIVRVDKDPEAVVEGESEGEGDNAGLLVRLEGGRVCREGFMAHLPDSEINGPFVKDLGLNVTPGGWIEVTDAPTFRTNVPGVIAVGDCATMIRAVSTAVYMGTCAAAGISHDLTDEDDVAH